MQTATCLIKTNDTSITKLRGVTPAEAVILRKIHQPNAGSEVIVEAVQTEDIPGQNELSRLQTKFGSKLVESFWPGAVKNLPQTFAEVNVSLLGASQIVVKPAPPDAPGEVEEPVPAVEAPVPIPDPENPAPSVKKPKITKSKIL